jgi:hypothetical protein
LNQIRAALHLSVKTARWQWPYPAEFVDPRDLGRADELLNKFSSEGKVDRASAEISESLPSLISLPVIPSNCALNLKVRH